MANGYGTFLQSLRLVRLVVFKLGTGHREAGYIK
jgi:hypothetical protein